MGSDWDSRPLTADDVLAHISEAIVTSKGWPRPIHADENTKRLLSLAESVAATPATVLLSGESGVGKEVYARYIHNRSKRADGPFVAINCAAIPDSLLESELFGHEKGAFSGAVKQHKGVFEQSIGGTLLLDEISEMPIDLQSKLLRVLQERMVRRVGGTKDVPIDIRVIATTNRDLMGHVDDGHFRRDLYYRLSVFPLEIPPLRDRPGDIPVLVTHYAKVLSEAYDAPLQGVATSAMERLKKYKFPGNVRELVNIMQRAMILRGDSPVIEAQHLAFETTPEMLDSMKEQANDDGLDEDTENDDSNEVRFKVGEQPLTEIRRVIILETLKHYDGNRSQTAAALGLSTRTIRNKLKDYRERGDLPED